MGIPGHLEGRSSPVLMPFSLYLNKRENLGRTVKEIPPTCSSTVSDGNCHPEQQRQHQLRTQKRPPCPGRVVS